MTKREDSAAKRGRSKESERRSETSRAPAGGATLGFETTLWQAADKLRNNMDAAEYKHVVLGLIFLKYISDAFEEKHAALDADKKGGADAEDPDENRAENIFWVPKEARWSHLQGKANPPTIANSPAAPMPPLHRAHPP